MLPRTMKSVVVVELGRRAELLDVPVPQPARGEVLLRVRYSGVSIGTEMWIATGRRLEGRTVPFPAAGYQATGEIVALGEGVEGFSAGQRVVAFCTASHSQFAVAGAQYVHRLPEGAPEKACALFVMPCVGAHALNHARVQTGEDVLVVGQGLIGQCTAQLARLRGAYVVASEVSPQRMAVSRRHCADWVVDARQGPVWELTRERFPDGFDVVLESTGLQELVEDAMRCVRAGGLGQGGRFVFEGWYPGAIAYTFHLPHSRQLQCFYPSFIGPRRDREGVLRLIASGALRIEPLISHVVPWRESAGIYNRLFTEERNRFNGIVFDWTGP